VLEVEEDGAFEGRVVGGGDVPEVVRDEPDRQRDGWPRDQPRGGVLREPRGKRRGNAENEERGRPLGEYDVLEEMRREEVVAQRVERGYRGREEEQAPGGEGSEPPALRATTDGEQVRDPERDDRQRRLQMERPGVRIRAADGATLGRPAGVAQW
jgi:hypothetical protein